MASTPEELDEYARDQERRGVVYLSRIPPFMKPEKIRYLLSQFGEVDHVYLAPESLMLYHFGFLHHTWLCKILPHVRQEKLQGEARS